MPLFNKCPDLAISRASKEYDEHLGTRYWLQLKYNGLKSQSPLLALFYTDSKFRTANLLKLLGKKIDTEDLECYHALIEILKPTYSYILVRDTDYELMTTLKKQGYTTKPEYSVEHFYKKDIKHTTGKKDSLWQDVRVLLLTELLTSKQNSEAIGHYLKRLEE